MSYERFQTLENGDEEILFVAVNRADSNSDVEYEFRDTDEIEHVMGSSYVKGAFKLAPYGFSVLHIIRKKTEE